ncbi:MBOAT family O-acyltransferase [Oligosphaera ethanolica]|uniref:D-alanyl-lipoteichoic acid acyltransferase DltB (MBOAT superfamily) n=1 Tax=Oligosphaera ethanolica TaxID=760260 RepID=A0AAE3VF29_9BACT|nr:MBOAT family O-acyltransferase [Oligosphaera ethanolica]MDQ0289323.1 D-alanyl-lipoteichoic acid acyltransferase DltB (MBOAT superfamily) [Oligosphaera ethanolica]
MLFNSYIFILVFCPAVISLYFLATKRQIRCAKVGLVLASLFFYSYFKLAYLPIIVFSILFNFYVGRVQYRARDLGRHHCERWILALGVTVNLGILFYFKYYAFTISIINPLIGTSWACAKILLPLGLSFYTFQQLSFLVDNYRSNQVHYGFWDYALFVTFFPQLIAGPIVLPVEMLPQFDDPTKKAINFRNWSVGLFLFSCGLAKKCFIADTLAIYSNLGFDSNSILTFAEAWVVALAFSLQLYYDFSGYCDMAMGLGLFFNIQLPLNFNSPYKAADFQEFWRRWHITLGRFMLNYLYIPLGGNRRSSARTLMNLLIVFTLSGIWHGAGVLFLAWGALHGFAILTHRMWKRVGWGRFCPTGGMPRVAGIAVTFVTVTIFWVFFRAQSWTRTVSILRSMFSFHRLQWLSNDFKVAAFDATFSVNKVGAILVASMMMAFFCPNSLEWSQRIKTPWKMAFLTIILFMLGFIFVGRRVPFLYFNF